MNAHHWVLGLCVSTLVLAACASMRDADGDGAMADKDCDDTRSDVHDGAKEVCDGVDQDCDGEVDNSPVDGGNAPAMVLTFSSGPYEYGSDSFLGLFVDIDATDPDGDLGSGVYSIWFDHTADGVLAADAEAFGEREIELPDGVDTATGEDLDGPDDECTGSTWGGGAGFAVGGHDTAYNTRYEFAVQMTDANGHQTTIQFVSGSSCREDGSPGDGTGS